jgi:hypothetical protein
MASKAIQTIFKIDAEKSKGHSIQTIINLFKIKTVKKQ